MKKLLIAFFIVLGTVSISNAHQSNEKMKSFGLSWASNYQSWPDGPNDWPHVTGLCHCGRYIKCGFPYAVRAGHMRYCMATCPFIHPFPDYPNGTTQFDEPIPTLPGDPYPDAPLPEFPEENL